MSDPTRADVEAAYGGPIPDASWEWLKKNHYIAELDDGTCSVEYVVEKLRELNSVAPVVAARLSHRVGSRDSNKVLDGINDRMEALSESIALRAARDTRVVAWRQRWLSETCVEALDVSRWIETTYRDHLPSGWPDDPGVEEATNSRSRFLDWPRRHVELQWIDIAERCGKVWPVPRRGPLGDLAALSGRLAANWDWHRGSATNFVLTGETPPRPGVRGMTFRARRGFDRDYGPYDFMWVRASIDIEISPEELAAWWRGIRSELGIAGRKPIGKKSTQLALFAMTRDDSTTYREDMHVWNKQAPEEWHFHDWRNFRTASRKAVNALNRPATNCSLP